MKQISVGMILEDGTCKILGAYDTYNAADRAVDMFSEMYPNAWVDILDGSLTTLT